MLRNAQHRVVILGAGFAGVACAKALARSSAARALHITLVDANASQLYQPALYEVLCTPRDVGIAALKQTATIPLADIVGELPITVQQSRVTYWDGDARIVHLESGQLPYDRLVVAFGSQSEFFGVEGAEKYSWPFKAFQDAVRFRNALADEFTTSNGPVTAVVSGGGFAGVECAGELACLMRRWSRDEKNSGHVVVVEGCPQLLPGLPQRVARLAENRLRSLGVEIRLNTLATRVTADGIELKPKERIATKFVLWTAGVRACPLPGASKEMCGARGRLATDQYLHLAGFKNVFAIGDIACIAGTDGRPLPQTASLAIDQGKYLAQQILSEHQKGKGSVYAPNFEGYVIPVGGKYAVFVLPSGFVLFTGCIGWILRRLVDLVYLTSVLPWWHAFKIWLHANRLFTRND